jgi:hypothetical protein
MQGAQHWYQVGDQEEGSRMPWQARGNVGKITRISGRDKIHQNLKITLTS